MVKEEEKNVEGPYYMESGMRKVTPHLYMYKTHTKGRWLGDEILKMFQREFKDQDKEYYCDAINSGKIKVNDKIVTTDYKLKDGDTITHLIMRGEPDVCGDQVKIIHRCKKFLVVNKPPTMPVHPAGRYYYNSMLQIVKHECKMTEEESSQMGVINRLDRLVSGIVVICMSREDTAAMQELMRSHRIKKTYICKVKGLVDWEEQIVDEPLRVINHQRGISAIDRIDGKPSITSFKVIRRDPEENVSYLYCYPKTGRTHQIRVHISSLGHPIVNDYKYDSSYGEYHRDDAKFICLHAYRYESDEWSFQSDLPFWFPFENIESN
jgi:tRNA pseudouridine synthase 9